MTEEMVDTLPDLVDDFALWLANELKNLQRIVTKRTLIVHVVHLAKDAHVLEIGHGCFACGEGIGKVVLYPNKRIDEAETAIAMTTQIVSVWLLTEQYRNSVLSQDAGVLLKQWLCRYDFIPLARIAFVLPSLNRHAFHSPIRQVADDAIHASVGYALHSREAVLVVYRIKFYHSFNSFNCHFVDFRLSARRAKPSRYRSRALRPSWS